MISISIKPLVGVLNRLVDEGNTMIIIEHNLDVKKIADHIVDLGPIKNFLVNKH